MTAVLLCLAAEPGRVVTRDELLAAVWPEEHITENVLSRGISELRKALGDDARSPRYIETIRKGGYRLVAPVGTTDQTLDPARVEPVGDRPGRPAGAARASYGWPVVVAVAAVFAVAIWVALERRGDDPAEGRPPGLAIATAEPSVEVIPLTSFRGSEVDPALSPDGATLAFSWSGEDADNYDIYVKSEDSEAPLRLTTHAGEDKNPAWSPDGRRIAFIRSAEGEHGIYVVPVLGGPERKLADCVSGDIPDLVWTADGGSLYFPDRRRLGDATAIHRLDLETLAKKAITRPSLDAFGDRDVAIDAAGRQVAFARATLPGVEDLWVGPIGGAARRLTWDGRSINGIEWLDEETVVFSSARAGLSRLWRVRPDGAGLAPLAATGEGAQDPSFSPTSGRLAFERRRYDFNVWLVSLSGATPPRPLLASTRQDVSARFSPDGSRIAFISNRTGATELWVAAGDGTGAVKLTGFGGDVPQLPRWAPDGRGVVLQLHRSAQTDLVLIDADTGRFEELTSTSWNEVAPGVTPDGSWIVYGSDETGRWQIWRRPVAGGEPVRLTEGGGLRAMTSADGATVFFVRPDHAGLWSVPFTGGSEVLVSAEPLRFSDWTVAPDGIYFRPPGDSPLTPVRIYRLDVETGVVKAVSEPLAMRAAPGSELDLHPDGEYALVGSIDGDDGDIVRVELPTG